MAQSNIQCGGKFRYETYGAANRAARNSRRRGDDRSHMNPYQCRFCKGFHIGHREVPKRTMRLIGVEEWA